MVQEAESMREADVKKKEAVTAKNDGETLVYQVEKQMTDLKEKISTADLDDLKSKIEAVRQAMASDDADPEEIKEKTKILQEASWKVTQDVYKQGSDSNSGEEGAGDAKDGEHKDSREQKDSKFEEKEKK